MAIIVAAANGPKTWGYAKVGEKFISFWGANGSFNTTESSTAAQYAHLWKNKRTNSGGYVEISVDELKQRMPLIPEEFFL